MWPRQAPPLQVRPFYLHRMIDASGVSGTGIVAVGAVLPSGKAVLEWRSRWKTVTVFESVDQVIRIHGHGGRTQLLWGDPPGDQRLPFWVQTWRALDPIRTYADHPQRLAALPAPTLSGPPTAAGASTPKDLYLAVRTRLADGWRRRLG